MQSRHADSLGEPAPDRLAGFHIMAKPIGPICNLDCKYCFYLDPWGEFLAENTFLVGPTLRPAV